MEKRIGVKGKQFEAIKFALIPRQSFARPTILNDGEWAGGWMMLYTIFREMNFLADKALLYR